MVVREVANPKLYFGRNCLSDDIFRRNKDTIKDLSIRCKIEVVDAVG